MLMYNFSPHPCLHPTQDLQELKPKRNVLFIEGQAELLLVQFIEFQPLMDVDAVAFVNDQCLKSRPIADFGVAKYHVGSDQCD